MRKILREYWEVKFRDGSVSEPWDHYEDAKKYKSLAEGAKLVKITRYAKSDSADVIFDNSKATILRLEGFIDDASYALEHAEAEMNQLISDIDGES